ncbi:MAG: transglutaminase domain-containing protein [Desulfamplus sp.]|nr:transglutaminase domain-containing protein [Desulfamplus sp.]
MNLYKNRRFWSAAIIACFMFVSLLVYRVEFYHGTFRTASDRREWSHKGMQTGESWMNIFQNFKKIGYTHRILESVGDGYSINEETLMKINTMGMTQEIRVKSASTTGIDFAIKTFDFQIVSGSFNFAVTGEIKGNTLYVESHDKIMKSQRSTDKSNSKPLEIPLENRPYLTSGIVQATVASGLEQDKEMVLFVFDPSTLGQAPATIKMEGNEDVVINGKTFSAQKASLYFKGAKQFAWIDENGEVLKEQGLLGITLVKTDRQGALDGAALEESEDLTRLVSVKADKTIERPEQLTWFKLRVSNIDGQNIDSLNSERQQWKDGILTIKKESLEGLPLVLLPEDLAAIDDRFKQSDAFIQSDDYRIRSFAKKAVSEALSYIDTGNASKTDTPMIKVQKMVAWIQKNIKRQPVISLPNALSTLQNRMGDCNEHAALLAAFCRATGIPAKIEAGMVYLNGRFYYHAWNSVFIGRWITVDALFNQIPADVTHISFSSGSQEMQLDLMGLIGRVKIEILDYRQ